MGSFIYPKNRTYVSELQFASLNSNIINQFECMNGERAGFRLEKFTDPVDGKELIISHIYDCSEGEINFLSSINVLPEFDLVGGLFSSGVFADGEIFDSFTKFWKANY